MDRMRTRILDRLLSARTVLALGSLLMPTLASAQWQPLGTYYLSGHDPISHSDPTSHGTPIEFTLAPDCVPCGSSTECYEGTSAFVEYQETVQGGVTTVLDVRLSYVSPCQSPPCPTENSSVHWWNVDVPGMIPCFTPTPILCGPIWGYDGDFACQGMCQFHFIRFQPQSSPVLKGSASPPQGTNLTWNTVSGASSYDVVRGDLDLLRSSHGDFVASTLECVADDRTSTSASDTGNPASKKTWWFLVRAGVCTDGGTYNTGSVRQVASRDLGINTSGAGCP